ERSARGQDGSDSLGRCGARSIEASLISSQAIHAAPRPWPSLGAGLFRLVLPWQFLPRSPPGWSDLPPEQFSWSALVNLQLVRQAGLVRLSGSTWEKERAGSGGVRSQKTRPPGSA